MKKDVLYITPMRQFYRDYVNQEVKMKGFDTMSETEYTSHVNISKSDLGANLFVLIILVASIVWLILGTGGGS